jgi:hypothetical protein
MKTKIAAVNFKFLACECQGFTGSIQIPEGIWPVGEGDHVAILVNDKTHYIDNTTFQSLKASGKAIRLNDGW